MEVPTSGPWLTVCVPTIGRPGLRRTLRSIRMQASPTDVEIIVAGDTYDGTYADALASAPELAAFYYAKYIEVDGGVHCVGQPQRQAAMERARGLWSMFSQDDNELNNGALAHVLGRCQADPRPKLFRAETTHGGGCVWREERLALGNADADGIVVLNDARRLGRWGTHYAGDFDFLQQTVKLYDGALAFEPFLIALKQKDG